MRLVMNDYRFCAEMSLSILKNQRKKLINDNIPTFKSEISNGLHSSASDENEIQSLWFQKYWINWLDNHWCQMDKILKNHPEYSEFQKKSFSIFFAKHFFTLIDECISMEVFNSCLIPDLLSEKLKAIEMLIDCSDKWEEKYQGLLAEEKKFNEKYKILLDNAHKQLIQSK